MNIIAYSLLALAGALIVLALTSCGTPYTIGYTDDASGVTAGYSSKRGFDINFQPFKPRSEK